MLTLLASSPAAALNIEDYKAMRAKLTSTDWMEANIARLTIAGYTQGVADALSVQRGASNRDIPVIPGTSICMPPSVRLSADLVRTALDQEIDGHFSFYDSAPEWEKGYATQLAMAGLLRMFPCNKDPS